MTNLLLSSLVFIIIFFLLHLHLVYIFHFSTYITAVIECADAAHGLGAQIISDGGCTQPGDVAKAFGGVK